MYWSEIAQGVRHAVKTSDSNAQGLMGIVIERAHRDVTRAKEGAGNAFVSLGSAARLQVRDAAVRSEALMREITGQGPEKTLRRGFALVRDQSGKPISRAAQTSNGSTIEIQFSDGKVSAVTGKSI